jgi:hypothetical protein
MATYTNLVTGHCGQSIGAFNMTTRQRNIRRYFFREMVASHDERICKAGKGPMVLTWREARNFWCIATNGARSH